MECVSVMARPKKNPAEMKTDAAMIRLFGKERLEALKRKVQELDAEKTNKRKTKKSD